MKKTLLLLTLSTVLSSSLAFAQDENENDQLGLVFPTIIKVTNNASTEHAIWVTIYNSIGRISDTACVLPSEVIEFGGYMPSPLSYEVRAEVKANMDCGGDTIADISNNYSMPVTYGIDADVFKSNNQYQMRLK